MVGGKSGEKRIVGGDSGEKSRMVGGENGKKRRIVGGKNGRRGGKEKEPKAGRRRQWNIKNEFLCEKETFEGVNRIETTQLRASESAQKEFKRSQLRERKN